MHSTTSIIPVLVTATLVGFAAPIRGAVGAEQDSAAAGEGSDFPGSVVIPTTGNSWVLGGPQANRRMITKDGITNWEDADAKIRTYFKTDVAGELNVGLYARSVSGSAEIRVTLGDHSEMLTVNDPEWHRIDAGKFKIPNAGYHFVELQGLESSAMHFPEIEHVLLSGKATEAGVVYVKDDFYWGRRGPSVHLGFQVPERVGDVLFFYNEITVPEKEDVLGSYFMANGFSQGYFGMQVNSPTERRILFSVWSPFQTDDPRAIPEEQRIGLLKKGEGVHTGEFGNEGSGGQSYLRFPWKAGLHSYGFLLKGQPTGTGETDFTAWFFAPEAAAWQLVASFRRPMTDTHLKGLHSFLENFMTETGHISRGANYSNQWVFGGSGRWTELTAARFTADATARKDARKDYTGGAQADVFFLRNCGFFDETTPIDSRFERDPRGTPPVIDFAALP